MDVGDVDNMLEVEEPNVNIGVVCPVVDVVINVRSLVKVSPKRNPQLSQVGKKARASLSCEKWTHSFEDTLSFIRICTLLHDFL